MKIAVFGWYGHDNAGDERIKYCLSSFLNELGGFDAIDFYDLHEEAIKGKTSKFDDYNLVIIGGGGLILSQHNYHDFIMGLNTKVVTLGISVETELKGNPKKFAEALLEKSDVFWVRDCESYEKIKPFDSNNKLLLSFDVSFLSPYELVSNIPNENSLAINFLSKTRDNLFVFKLKNNISRFFPFIEPSIISFRNLVDSLNARYKLIPIPLYCEEKSKNIPLFQSNDVMILSQYFHMAPKYFNHEKINNCASFLSMRLHGLIFAAQKGIPFTTFSTYPKQKNFMKDVGLQDLCIDIHKLENTMEKLSMITQNEGIIKEKILTYRAKAVSQSREDLNRIMNHILN